MIYDSDKFTKLANESDNANELSRALHAAVKEVTRLRDALFMIQQRAEFDIYPTVYDCRCGEKFEDSAKLKRHQNKCEKSKLWI